MARGVNASALPGLWFVAALTAVAFLLSVLLAPAYAEEPGAVIPAPLPADIAELRMAQQPGPVLTTELLQNYIARKQALEQFDGFYVAPQPQLTVDLLNSYIARRSNPALAAIEAVEVEPTITSDLVSAFVSKGYVPTGKKLELAADEKLCLTQAIYHEARGESESGQLAVANIIINRAMSKRYPSTICGVVFQNADKGKYRCQFTFACDGRSDFGTERAAWSRAARLADVAYAEFIQGERPGVLPNSALFYHTKAVSPNWSSTFQRVATIGSHIFYASR
jgi:hypothetical protein